MVVSTHLIRQHNLKPLKNKNIILLNPIYILKQYISKDHIYFIVGVTEANGLQVIKKNITKQHII